MIIGNQIINELSKNIYQSDIVSSSHWNYYHKDFKFDGKNLYGLEGFGNLNKPYFGPLKFLHLLFQKRFRLLASNIKFFNKIDQIAENLAKKQNRAHNLDIIRQSLTVDFLNYNLDFRKLNTAIIIGDGFGTLSSILINSNLIKKVIIVNLTKTLLVDLFYIKKEIGEERFSKETILLKKKSDIDFITNEVKYIAIEGKNYNLLKFLKKDIVINIVSFQEMDKKIINNYFNYLYNDKSNKFYFYLCNREKKFLPDGSEIKFNEYPFLKDDQVIIDELCPWNQNFYSLRPPFYRKYEGPVRHQLRLINSN